MTEPARDPSPPQNRSLGAPTILFAFLWVGLTGFGGVMPWMRRMVIEQRRWMSAQEFNEAVSFCQILPGPNMVNFAVVFGARHAGAVGALAAVVGLMTIPVVLAVLVGALYAAFGEFPPLQRILAGLGAAAAGLLIGTTAKMAHPLFLRPREPAALLAVAVFAAVAIGHWPLLRVLLVFAPLSLALHWGMRARSER